MYLSFVSVQTVQKLCTPFGQVSIDSVSVEKKILSFFSDIFLYKKWEKTETVEELFFSKIVHTA